MRSILHEEHPGHTSYSLARYSPMVAKQKRFDLFDRDRTEEKHKQLERENDEA